MEDNKGVTASSIIDRAISLKEGGVIIIPCSSYASMERLRIRLYKVKNKLAKSYGSVANTIDIARKSNNEKHVIYVSKETSLDGVFIMEEGEAMPFTCTEDSTDKEVEQEVEQEVEVEEKDFDEVAAEIEACQNLTEDRPEEPEEPKALPSEE